VAVIQPAHLVVVEYEASNPSVFGEGARLRFDFLSCVDPSDGSKVGVAVEQLEIPGELLDTIDITSAFDFDSDVSTRIVGGEDVDWSKSGHVFPSHQRVAFAQNLYLRGQEFLKVRLDAIFDQAWIFPEVMRVVRVNLMDVDHQEIRGLMVDDFPRFYDACFGLFGVRFENLERTGWGHPVQRFVASAIGVNKDASISFDHDDPGGQREMSTESARVINRTGCNDEPHGLSV